MLTSTLLVTIHGPFKTLDLELPGDIAISELLPFLVEICATQKDDPADARLQVAGISAVLPAHKTLVDAGVDSGTVLVLQTQRGYEVSPNSLAHQQFGRRSGQPAVHTAGIGITWEPL